MIHKAFTITEIAERYYKAKGNFVSREQSKKNFSLLKHPDKKILRDIFKQIHKEQMKML